MWPAVTHVVFGTFHLFENCVHHIPFLDSVSTLDNLAIIRATASLCLEVKYRLDPF